MARQQNVAGTPIGVSEVKSLADVTPTRTFRLTQSDKTPKKHRARTPSRARESHHEDNRARITPQSEPVSP